MVRESLSYATWGATIIGLISMFILILVSVDPNLNTGIITYILFPIDYLIDLGSTYYTIFLTNESFTTVIRFVLNFFIYFITGALLGGFIGWITDRIKVWKLKRHLNK